MRDTHLAFRELFNGPVDLPSEQRWDADERTKHPHEADHDGSTKWSAFFQVVYGLRDRPISVQADEAQIHDGRCAQ